MKRYLFLGAVRSAIGILLLTYLVGLGYPLTYSLLLVVLVGFFLYVIQVRISIGFVDFASIALVFVGAYAANRVLLWVFFEQLKIPVFFAQSISIVLLVAFNFLFLRRLARKSV